MTGERTMKRVTARFKATFTLGAVLAALVSLVSLATPAGADGLEARLKAVAGTKAGDAASLGTPLGVPLAKTGALTATSYVSTYFNVNFTCPSGWQITAFDSSATTAILTVSKSGRNSVLVYLTRHATATEARYMDSYATFMAVRITYGSSIDYPVVRTAFDTTSEPMHLSYVQVDYTLSGNVARVYDLASASSGIHGQFVAYSATLADYNANHADYDAIWDGLNFNTVSVEPGLPPNPLPKGVTWSGATLLNPHGFRVDLHDARGRTVISSSERRIVTRKADKLFPKVRAQ
jgi:hypothetical protein